jgi:predicted dehydrogenase
VRDRDPEHGVTGSGSDGGGPLTVALLSAAHVHAPGWAAALKRCSRVGRVLVADDDRPRGEALADRVGVDFERDIDRAVAQADAFVIAAENSRHRWWWDQVRERRRPVLCEKPLATRVEDGRAMVLEAEALGTSLWTALPVRTLPASGRLRDRVRGGAVGRVLALLGTNHGYRPPGWFLDPELAGGGAVMDHVSHVVDLMRWITGGEPLEVSAETSRRLYGGSVDDAGLILMTWSDGALATLDPSWSRLRGFPTWGDVTLEVVGTEGRAWLDPLAEHLDLYQGEVPTHRYLGYGDNMDDGLLAAFLDVVLGKPPPATLATGRDGFVAMAVSVAAYQSAEQGRPVAVARL